MSSQIRFTPRQADMQGTLTEVPAFPGENFSMAMPETLGDANQSSSYMNTSAAWTQSVGGAWICNGQRPGELSYVLTVTPGYDTVDVHISITNESNRSWTNSLAFNCFQCGYAPSIADYECVRHWARVGTEFKSLIAVPRKFSSRPTVQLYNVAGAPAVAQIPFASGFNATPNAVLEGWLAIRSRDGLGLAAVVSRPALFLFQNMEYSCIHSAQSLGALEPGHTGDALTRIYLTRSTLADWHTRMLTELGP